MAQRRSTKNEMHRLGPWLNALRVLANSKVPQRDALIEKYIDEYLRTDPFSLIHALERLRRAIHYEELERRKGDDWSVAKNYVRLLLHRMVSGLNWENETKCPAAGCTATTLWLGSKLELCRSS